MVASRTTVTVDFAEIRSAVRAVDEEAQALDASVTDGPPGLVGMPSHENDTDD